MELIFADKNKRTIKGNEKITFSSDSSFYLLKLTARAKGEKQLGPNATDDEDLTIQIDGKTFPKLENPSRLVDSPAAISGGRSHNLSQTTYFLTFLKDGDHQVTLSAEDPPGTATFECLEVYALEPGPSLSIDVKSSAEDGDRRPWLTFVLDNLPLLSFAVAATVKKRYRDSDDLKIVVDGEVKTNFGERKEKPKESLPREWFYRFWYFAGSLLLNKRTAAFFRTNLPQGLHYVEIDADRMPYVDSVELSLLDTVRGYRDVKYGRDYNQLDKYIVTSVRYWNDFFLNQLYPPPEPLDTGLVKAIVYRESRLGYYPDDKIIDVMQVWDPKNPPQQAFLGKTPANEFISSEKIGHISYSYSHDRGLPHVTNNEESIFWGVRWLYHKAQYLQADANGELIKPYVRLWRTWLEAVRKYNANPAVVENYISEVTKVYQDGRDLEGNILWRN